jgi:predicted acyl esterase
VIIEWDVPITMSDGLTLRADVFRPDDEQPAPVLLGLGPYAKGLPFEVGYPDQWKRMIEAHPDVTRGTTSAYQNWEVPDPERWVPEGYACVRVDARGTGRSPGYLDHFSPRETRDLYESIEWAGTQPWSSGRVGLSGVSYFAINAWHVAGMQPPHLAAMVPWEGAADWYRDMTHHGGIVSTFWANWYDMQVLPVQHGVGSRSPVNPHTGEPVAGPAELDDETRAANRSDLGGEILAHPLDGPYHRERSADWPKVRVPFLSAANWGGLGLHSRGNFEAFTQAASTQKWLEVHGLEHWTEYYTDYGIGLQRRFFDHYLKGLDNGWERTPRVLLQVRHLDRFVERTEDEWPLARTDWTTFHLDAGKKTLRGEGSAENAEVGYDPFGDGVTFLSDPLPVETEITGPSAVRLFASSETSDADIFAVLRAFGPDDEEVTFQGALDPHTPLSQGWLRASLRRLDPEQSMVGRPFHAHDRREPLEPGEVYELEVELWPTCIVLPAGYRLGLTIRGTDYVYPKLEGEARLGTFKNALTGSGPFLHDDPRDRPTEIFGGRVTLHTGPDRPASLLIPVIPLR